MPRVNLGPLFLEASAALERADSKAVLKDFLLWLAVSNTGDRVNTKGQTLQELIRLCHLFS